MNIQYSNTAKIGWDNRCCIAWEAESSPVINRVPVFFCDARAQWVEAGSLLVDGVPGHNKWTVNNVMSTAWEFLACRFHKAVPDHKQAHFYYLFKNWILLALTNLLLKRHIHSNKSCSTYWPVQLRMCDVSWSNVSQIYNPVWQLRLHSDHRPRY